MKFFYVSHQYIIKYFIGNVKDYAGAALTVFYNCTGCGEFDLIRDNKTSCETARTRVTVKSAARFTNVNITL